MTDRERLAIVRMVHTVIYVVMAAGTLVVLVAGLFGLSGMWLWVALGLMAVEVLVFVGNGMRCPLTALAVQFGAERGYAFDTLLPESFTRHTFRLFGTMLAIGLLLLLARRVGAIG